MGGEALLGGRYRMVERLGSGGMSDVWRGYDEVLDRPVAIKVLASRLMNDGALRRRVRIEARAAARLSHPHITGVYDYGESPGPDGEPIPFVVMELVDGVPMSSHLAGGRTLPWRVGVSACAQVAKALSAAHANGVVHRDVKPSNVILTPGGVKVLDFGISAMVGEPDLDEDGTLLGTPAYLAPERLDGGAVSPASDVYALGLLLYRSLTGRLPWDADTTTQMLIAHLRVEPRPMPPVAGLPPAITRIVERCLDKCPADRPTSEQAANELAAVLATAPFRAPAPLAYTVDIQVPRRPATAETVAGIRHRTARWHPSAAVRLFATGMRTGRQALSVTGLVVCAGLIWGATAWSDGTDPGQGTPAMAAQGTTAHVIEERPDSCKVEYRVSSDSGRTTTAELAVTNTGPDPLDDWRLAFDLPGDQQLRHGTNATWRQDDRTVTARAATGAVLPPEATARLSFTAGYHASNPLPVTYEVNGITCTAVVLGATPGDQTTSLSNRSGTARASSGQADHNKRPAGKGERKNGKSNDDD